MTVQGVTRQKTKLTLTERPRSLCVCTIVPGLPAGISHPTLGTLMGIRDVFQKIGAGFVHVGVTGLSYEHALAEVCAKAMQLSTCEDFLFLDADIATDPQWAAVMTAMPQDILCGTYQQRTDPDGWCVNNIDTQIAAPEMSPEGILVVPINDTGFGWVRLRRRVIEAMAKHFPELSYYSQDEKIKGECHALWDPFVFEHGDPRRYEGKMRRRRTAGDTCFFKRARMAGFQPWAAAEMVIDHAGMGPKSLMQWVEARQKKEDAAKERLVIAPYEAGFPLGTLLQE